MTLSGAIFASLSNYWILLFAAVVGVISPSGNEIGPFRAVEESTLAHLTEANTRSDIFALYVVSGTLGTAGGSLAAGWMTHSLQSSGWTETSSYRLVFWLYAAIGVIKCGMTFLLSQQCEVQPKPEPEPQPVELRHSTNNQNEEQQAFLDESDEEEENTPKPEPVKKTSWIQLSKKSQITLAKLCGLFFFDSLAR